MVNRIDYKEIGRRIREYRLSKGLTQDDLCEKSMLSNTHISNIETGNTHVSLATLVNLANILDVTVDELLYNSILKSKDYYLGDLQNVLEDCTPYEVRIISDLIKSVKESLRKNSDLFENGSE